MRELRTTGVVFDLWWITSLYNASRGSYRNALDLAAEESQNDSAEKWSTALAMDNVRVLWGKTGRKCKLL